VGTWTSNGSGGWTLSGTGRTAWRAPQQVPGNAAILIQLADCDDQVRVCIPSSPDMRTCIEIGVTGADVVIQLVENASVTSVLATTAHGLTSNVPYSMEVRKTEETWEVRLNNASAPTLSYTSAGELEGYRHCGFVSSVTGARVVGVTLYDLIRNLVPRADIHLSVKSGALYASIDGEPETLLRQGAFNRTGRVSLRQFHGEVFGVDGANAVAVDLATLGVSAWGASSGAGVLPGATESSPGVFVPGTTRMTFLENDLDRLVGGGDPNDPQNLNWCAIGDARDWDDGDSTEGAAVSLNAALPGRLGEPVVGVKQIGNGALVIGCTHSFWRKRGDFALGTPELVPVVSGQGLSDVEAIDVTPDGSGIAHSTEGVILIPPYGLGRPLSQGVITEGINLDRSQLSRYRIIVRRDPKRFITYFLFSQLDQHGGFAFAYDERIGGFAPGAGGFFVDAYPAAVGPASAVVHRGSLMWGTWDGRILAHDEAAAATGGDDGQPIASKCPMQLLDKGRAQTDTILHALKFTFSLGSGAATFAVYGGATPEAVYTATARRTLLSGQCPIPRTRRIATKVRAACIIVVISAANAFWRLDDAIAEWSLAMNRTGAEAITPTPPRPCRSPRGDLVHPDEAPPTVPVLVSGPGIATAYPVAMVLWSDAGAYGVPDAPALLEPVPELASFLADIPLSGNGGGGGGSGGGGEGGWGESPGGRPGPGTGSGGGGGFGEF
jgi:uncharacterized membrane protein YgcG